MATRQTEPLHIVYYCTGHGLGHATRVIEICKKLALSNHTLTICTGAPASAFLREVPAKLCTIRKQVLDSGSRQKDAFSVDMRGERERCWISCAVQRTFLALLPRLASPLNRVAHPAGSLEDHQKTCVVHRSTLLETESAWLQAVKADLVVSDIVPLACAAAAQARIPCVCVSNFSWGKSDAASMQVTAWLFEPDAHGCLSFAMALSASMVHPH